MISILTTLRTGVQFLPECATSISAQAYPAWEWLIGVNGFCAHSPLVAYARSFLGEGVYVFDCWECETRPQASHYLLEKAQGDLIAIHDVDDRWHPSKLAAQVKVMENPEIGVCGTRGRYFGAQDNEPPIDTGYLNYKQMLERNSILHSSVLMRREHCKWPDTDLLDDYPLWLDLLKQGVFFFVIDKELVRIRIHPDQYYAGARDNSEAIRAERRK